MANIKPIRFCLVLTLLCALLTPHEVQAARSVPALQTRDTLPLDTFLDWMPDPGGKLRIQEISNPEFQTKFTSSEAPSPKFPPHAAGALWLRFTLAPASASARQAAPLLDMGDDIPGEPLLFAPRQDAEGNPAWREIRPDSRGIFLLPEVGESPITLFIRLDGPPSPWFSPTLRTPTNAATAVERMARPAVVTALAAAALLCLLRGLSEKGQWRFWTALYTATAFISALWGTPAAPDGNIAARDLPSLLAPGIALMLLPHVGRHLMRTATFSRALDIQCLLLSLPGAAVALLPLTPGFSWTTQYLPLWPTAVALFLPTAIGAWLCGLPGSRRFLLACLAPLLGVAAGMIGLHTSAPAALLATGPLWGTALGALLIAGTASPVEYAEENRARNTRNFPGTENTTEGGSSPDEPYMQTFSADTLSGLSLTPPIASSPLNLNSFSDQCTPAQNTAETNIAPGMPDPEEPGLRLLPPEEILDLPPPDLAYLPESKALFPENAPFPESPSEPDAFEQLPPANLDLPAFEPMPESAATGSEPEPGLSVLASTPEPEPAFPAFGYLPGPGLSLSVFEPTSEPLAPEPDPAALAPTPSAVASEEPPRSAPAAPPEEWRPLLDKLLRESTDINLCALPPAARQHAAAIEKSLRELAALPASSPAQTKAASSSGRRVFNLQQILREIHDKAAEKAERKGLSISWFMPPHLPQYYFGNAESLSEAVRLLVENSIQAAQKGFVQIVARRVPESVNPGHLLFSVSDTGPGMPPDGRNSYALTRAWELAGAHGGSFSAESDMRGSTVSFSLHFEPHIPAPGKAPHAAPPVDFAAPHRRDSFDLHTASMQEIWNSPASVRGEPTPFPAALDDFIPTPRHFYDRFEEERGDIPPPPSSAHVRSLLLKPFDKRMPPPAEEEFEEMPDTPPDSKQGDLLAWVEGARRPNMQQPEPLRRNATASPPPLPVWGRPTPQSTAGGRPGENAPAPRSWAERARSFFRSNRSAPPARHESPQEFLEDHREWVGEPMPIAHAANPASDGASGSASAGAHASGERRPVLQEQAARRESSYAAPLEASEWVGEPVSIPRAAPEAHDFVPLRLTDGRPAPSKAENASEAAPETASDPAASTPGKTVTLFPDDSSLLGFVLSGPSAGASSAATPEAKRPKTVAGSTFSPVRTAPPSAHEKQESPSASAVEHIRPLIPGLLASLDEGMTEVRRGFSKSDTAEVEEAAARIAAKADNYGLRILARMARCVEMAARARDKDAIANILPDLETAVERNRIALTPKTAA